MDPNTRPTSPQSIATKARHGDRVQQSRRDRATASTRQPQAMGLGHLPLHLLERQGLGGLLQSHIHESLDLHNGLDMMGSLDCQVFENRALFDAASPVTVRDHFRQWVKDAPQREQGEGITAMRSQRYNFCIHVDEEALQSVVSGPAPPADTLGTGYVNIVCLQMLGDVRAEFETEDAELDRCWMRVTYQDLMPTWYNLFRTQGAWFTEYREPPQVATV